MRKTLTFSLAAAATLLAGGVAWAQAETVSGVTRAQAEQRAAERFARMDANDDGRLDQADRAARETALFDRVDADGNGAISREEFSAGREARRETRAERGDRGPRFAYRAMRPRGGPGMVRAADADRDGAITAAEFAAAARARFDRIDTDKDGTISLQERLAQRLARRAERQAG